MRRRGRTGSDTFAGYAMVLPFYLVFLVFHLSPILVGLSFSFTNYDLYRTMEFVGLANYIRLFNDPLFVKSILNTILYALYTIVPSIALGLAIALVLNRPLFGLSFFRVSFYLPFIVSMVAASMVWLWIYNPSVGLLNALLELVGIEPKFWLHDPGLAMGSVAIMSVWKIVGYNMIIFLAGLQSIPRMYYEVARIDGANRLQQFFKVTFPLLAPTTFFLFVTSSIQAFNVFVQVNILTNGGPVNSTTTIVHQIYTRAFTEFKMGYASAMAVLLFAMVAVITMLNFRFGNRGTDTEIA